MITGLSSFKVKKEAENLSLLELSVLSPSATCAQLALHLLLFLSTREAEMQMEMYDQPCRCPPTGARSHRPKYPASDLNLGIKRPRVTG